MHSRQLLRVIAGLRHALRVFDLVVGRLHHNRAHRVVSGAASTAGDLMELAGAQAAHPCAVVLHERRDEHRADRHVDANAERVGAADHPQVALLRELLDKASVSRQHAGVVHADPLPQESAEDAPKRGREPEVTDRIGNGLFALWPDHLGRGHRLRSFDCIRLREVHDVDGRTCRVQEVVDGLVHWSHGVLEAQRHWPLDAGHEHRLAAGAALKVTGDHRHVAERCRHQQELRVCHSEQRHLPRPPTIGVGVEVELVHDHLADRRIRPVPQGNGCEDLGRAAHDGGVSVDGRVAGDEPHPVGAEELDQGKELLIDEGFDRGGVVRAVPARERGEVRADGDQRLS